MKGLGDLSTYVKASLAGLALLGLTVGVNECADCENADDTEVIENSGVLDVSSIRDGVLPQVEDVYMGSLFEDMMQRRIELMPNSVREIMLLNEVPIMVAIFDQGMSVTDALNTFGPLEGHYVFYFMTHLNGESALNYAAVRFLCDLSTYDEVASMSDLFAAYPWVLDMAGVINECFPGQPILVPGVGIPAN